MKKNVSCVIYVVLFSSVFSVSGMLKRPTSFVGASAKNMGIRAASTEASHLGVGGRSPDGASPAKQHRFGWTDATKQRRGGSAFSVGLSYETTRLPAYNDDDALNGESIDAVVKLLKDEEIAAICTETVYGLGAIASSAKAVDSIFKVKDRDRRDPLIVHIYNFEKVRDWIVGPLPAAAEVLASKFWPGPLTMLFDKAPHVLDEVTSGLSTIGLRVPRNTAFLEVLRRLNTGVAAPSANPHKKMSPTAAHHVMKGLGGKIPAILDGGWCQIGMESTIVDVRSNPIRILRAGDITHTDLENALADDPRTASLTVALETKHSEVVPGNQKAHYQVDAPTLLMSLEEITKVLAEKTSSKIAILYYSESAAFDVETSDVTCYKLPSDRKGYQRDFFKYFDEADEAGVDMILIENPPREKEWAAVWQHLDRAEHPEALSALKK